MKYLFYALIAVVSFNGKALLAVQEDSGTIGRILRRSFDQKADIREPALKKLRQSRESFEKSLVDDLDAAKESKQIQKIASDLFLLVSPRPKIDPNVDGSVNQATLPREIESTNASTVRPVSVTYGNRMKAVLHQKLTSEIKKFDAFGELDFWFDKSEKNKARIQAQSETRQAIRFICLCMDTVGNLQDVYKLEMLLKEAKTPGTTFFLTKTIQRMLGFAPEVYFNGMCGVGVTREMIERERKDEKKMAEDVRGKVLKFLKEHPNLDRAKAMELVVKKEFHVLKDEVSHYNAIHFSGGASYPLGFAIYGKDILEFIEKNYDVKNGGRTQGNFEAMRASIASEFDEDFVRGILKEDIKFLGAKMCAVKIIANAGSKKFKDELVELAKYIPTKKKSGDYKIDYLFALRQSASATLAACHGKAVLAELKSIEPLDSVKTGYFDYLPYVIKEIEGSYPEFD